MEKPVRKSCLPKHFENPGVINGVKGFGGIQQKNKSLGVFDDALKKELVDIFNMGMSADASQKTSLRWVEELSDSGHNGVGDGLG